jgi:hypothetical protein
MYEKKFYFSFISFVTGRSEILVKRFEVVLSTIVCRGNDFNTRSMFSRDDKVI